MAQSISDMQLNPYPPFGLSTISYVGLASFRILIGLYSSAVTVSQNRQLRKEFYKSAKSQLTLLGQIGVAQMENELLKRYKIIKDFSKTSEIENRRYEKDDVRDALDDLLNDLGKEHVRELLHEVLIDLYSKTEEKQRNNNQCFA